jgi:serine protease Do
MARYERFIYVILILALLFVAFRTSPSSASLLEQFQNGFVSVVKKVTPVVVNISAQGTVNAAAAPYANGFQGNPFQQFLKQFFIPQYKEQFTSLGSGMIIRSDGYILTNDHVIRNASKISVILSSGKTYRNAKIVGVDPISDLAILKINPHHPLPAGKLGNSDHIQVGQWAIAIGNPYGFRSTVTVGVISALNRDITVHGQAQAIYHDLIQTDAPINPGNSGGALVNIHGKIVGMNTAIATPSGGDVGIGFAIPINIVKSELYQLITKGKVVHGYLGIYMEPLTPSLVKYFGIKKGVLVAQVISNGPAAKAGIKQGDVIVNFNGHKVSSPQSLLDFTIGTEAGTKVMIEVLRGRQKLYLPVVIGARPAVKKVATAVKTPSFWGMHLKTITPSLKQKYNLQMGSGLLVVLVDPNSLAQQAGITPGDIIQQVDRQPIKSVGEFEHLLKTNPTGPTLLLVDHQGFDRFIVFYSHPK